MRDARLAAMAAVSSLFTNCGAQDPQRNTHGTTSLGACKDTDEARISGGYLQCSSDEYNIHEQAVALRV